MSVVIKSVVSTYTGRKKLLPGARFVETVGKLKNGSYNHGLSKDDVDNLKNSGVIGEDINKFLDEFKVIITDDGITLEPDMYVIDKLKLNVLKASGAIASNKNLIQNQHMFYIYDEEQESVELIKKSKIKKEALDIIDKVTPEEMRKILYTLGQQASGISNNAAMAKLLTLAETNPGSIVKAFTDPDSNLKVMFNQAISKGFITKIKGIYYYNDTYLGKNQEECIRFFKDTKNNDIREHIKFTVEEANKIVV